MALTATAGVAAFGLSSVQAQAETFEFQGEVSGWMGQAPEAVAGETNPTIELEVGQTYQVVWTNADGQPHDFVILDENEQEVVGTDLVSEEGATATLEFEASEEMAEYYCSVHPNTMRGGIDLVELEEDGEEQPEDGDGEEEDGDEEPADGEREATLSVSDQTGDGETLVVEEASATVEYYVDAHYDGNSVQTEDFGADTTQEDLEVMLDPPLEEETTVEVGVHAHDDGEELAAEEIQYTVEEAEEPEEEPTATVTFSDQDSDGETVVVDSTSMSEGGFVAMHDETLLEGDAFGSVVGVSEYLEAGDHSDVEVTLDEPLEENQTLIAMPHRDTNDNQEYDFVDTQGEEDGPYVDEAGDAVIDDGCVRVE